MIATTGFFDGVHLGHRLVIERLVSLARERGDESLVVTFWPHPRAVLQDGARELRLLNSLEEKKELLRCLGVDRIEVLDFTRSFAALSAEQYLREILRDRFGVTTLLMGYDNRLGSDRLTADKLLPKASAMDIELIELEPFGQGEHPETVVASDDPSHLRWAPPSYMAEGGHRFPDVHPDLTHISSTIIRKSLEKGEVALASEMLGYGYALRGVVVAGNRLGRTIGFPTANMKLYEPLKLVPGRGVYVVEAEVLGKKYRGMTNIGLRPTVGGSFTTIETHILDFDEDIYGLPLRITFLRRLRDEVHFPSLEALKRQLEMDRDCCREQK
ncbi:MAG: bifunctional riboflavin kinase/FMN adenylyltransferase [Bacteroidales bacterium]|nr:bifunctional riboflavin kinase/FMN adenylyltransferase [Bacteroidales bacterium]